MDDIQLRLENYPGGKGAPGVAQTIINTMPPHDWYIETHGGQCKILKTKTPAKRNTLIDLNPVVINAMRPDRYPGRLEVVQADCLDFVLSNYTAFTPETLLYLDPPYLFETRTYKRPIYDFEYTRAQHIELLYFLVFLDSQPEQSRPLIILSGYPSALYDRALRGWEAKEFWGRARSGARRIEKIWFNFPPPEVLHDFRFLGGDYRERERIKKKINRNIAKFSAMEGPERQALLNAIYRAFPPRRRPRRAETVKGEGVAS